MPKRPAPAGESTRAVHAGEREHQATQAITTPIYQTSTFHFESSEEVIAYQEGRSPRDEYGRYGNPTWRAVERKLSELEGVRAEGDFATVLFASGMCAATTSFLALLPAGSHLVVTSDCYRRTRQFLNEYLTRMGVEVSVIEPADTKKLGEALRDDTVLFFTESPTNPYLRVIDVPETVRVCHERGVKVMMDSTFASPVNQTTLEHGADFVLHSCTKYLGGHNDLLAGSVTGPADLVEPVRKAAGVLGGVIDPHAAWLLLRGLKTLGVRMAKHNENGMHLSAWLESHPKVRRVWYPGLESHPDHAVARAQMRGFGGVVTFELDTDLDGAKRFVDAVRLPYQAPSLGGVETLVELPVTMSFWDYSPEQRREWGITDTLVRLACGIEDAADLVADLDQALARV